MVRHVSQVVLAFLITASALAAPPIEKVTITSKGRSRIYYLYVPQRPAGAAPMPLVVTLHGSGRNGRILIEHWQKLADTEGIVLAGPDATDTKMWQMPPDGPDFIKDVVDDVKTKAAIDPRRIYLFGHSAGAGFAMQLGLLESKYFAAIAIHAGALDPNDFRLTDYAERKIPLFIAVGDRDAFFPLSVVRATRDALVAAGIPVELWEIPRHTHDYYSESRSINDRAWKFLTKLALDKDPAWKEYDQ
jgi:poly(3-hydroxybutyrate) depolymerase